ncbi:flagellar biosynthesis protein FliQ [Roseburia sp. BX1005]|uniref:Flagellar biosynthetic protein FliQ n=1 Tax=Roseburia zhanii TaxID=2763064 RepID=A0A923RSY8_9FIRM|nr:flagellar biosynthesis protein FliQ [Roseburia zhanii]MBC5713275.1 flagellar biosynthesis protein FliQ [Roseburia zhanii]OLA92233.1 MAG: flagellar biosynthetic protein FliQ [Roseburia sp. 40_7]
MITQGDVITIAKEAIYTIIVSSAPLLLISLIVGLVISIFQTVTSIQEQTLTFVPKIIAVFLGIMLFGPWMLDIMSNYMTRLWTDFSIYLS